MATFVRRKDSKGKDRITAMVRLQGLPRKTATFENMTKAKKWAQQMEVNLRDGRFLKESESIKHTVNELVERFIEEMEIRSFKSINNYTQMLRWWSQELGHLKLSELTPSLIKEKQT